MGHSWYVLKLLIFMRCRVQECLELTSSYPCRPSSQRGFYLKQRCLPLLLNVSTNNLCEIFLSLGINAFSYINHMEELRVVPMNCGQENLYM